MGKYSKAKSMAQWRASLGKHETQKPRKQALSFTELQSYVESHGVAASQHKTNQAEDKIAKYREARIKKGKRKSKSQTRREYHEVEHFRLVLLLGTLLILSERVSGNERYNRRHQDDGLFARPIQTYSPMRQRTSPMWDVSEEFKRDSQPFYPLSTMLRTPVQHRIVSGLKTRHIHTLEEKSPLTPRERILLTHFQTPLHKACQETDLEAVRDLLSKGADFTIKNREGKTAFDIACEQDALDIVRLLLEFGYDPERAEELDMDSGLPVTDLFLAVHHNNYKLAYTLLEYSKARPYRQLIRIAERNHNLKMKELLQAHLSTPSSKETSLIGLTTIAGISTVQFQGKDRFNQVNQQLFDRFNTIDSQGLFIGPEKNVGACIYQTYLDEGGQLKNEHWTFSTSESYEFCLAILSDSYEDIVRLFPTVDRNDRLPRGYNWMIISALSDDPRIPNFFLYKEFDVNYRTEDGKTVLHTLAANNHSRSIPNYIAAGANVNAQDNKGWTPLMSAIFNQNLEQAKELLVGGADLFLRDKRGRDARAIAFEYGCLKELNEILISLGKKPLLRKQQTVSAEKEDILENTADDSSMTQYGAVLAGTVITVLTVAYYAYRKRQPSQPRIQSAPVGRPRKKVAAVDSDRKIVPPGPMNEPDIEGLRKK